MVNRTYYHQPTSSSRTSIRQTNIENQVRHLKKKKVGLIHIGPIYAKSRCSLTSGGPCQHELMCGCKQWSSVPAVLFSTNLRHSLALNSLVVVCQRQSPRNTRCCAI